MPFREPKPEEILTIANRILGSGQTSLAKYLIIAANEDNPKLDTHDIPNFLKHVLERIDWKRDLHFHTNTTIDTLDYSGSGWNSGSKVVMACCGPKIRELSIELPENFKLDADFTNPSFALPGILLIKGKKYQDEHFAKQEMFNLEKSLKNYDLNGIAMIVLVDDSHFGSNTLNNFLWVTFTRSNPAYDIHGVGCFYSHKHWGCTGPLIIDARVKPHHAPTLEVDKKTKEKVDQLFAKGGELSGLI
jgi:4-hydroxy-3-polyprenylbenzoate decarboxylase